MIKIKQIPGPIRSYPVDPKAEFTKEQIKQLAASMIVPIRCGGKDYPPKG